MNNDDNLHEQADELREETAAEAPELQEHDRFADIQRELEDVQQQVLYAQAETQNVRRRLEQEKLNASTYAVTGFARDMLSVKDNLDRALAAVPEELRADEKVKALLTGIEATSRELDNVFQRNGIVRIEAMNTPLDPNRHQAMVEIPNEEAEPGTIIQEMQAGYMIKDRLLRPALVAVAKKP